MTTPTRQAAKDLASNLLPILYSFRADGMDDAGLKDTAVSLLNDFLTAREADLQQERDRWFIECERLANGLVETFKEQAHEDGDLKPQEAVDTAFRLLDDWVDRAKSAEALVTQRSQERDALVEALGELQAELASWLITRNPPY